MYRKTPHTTNGVSPSQLLFGCKLRTKLPEPFYYKVDDLEVCDGNVEQKKMGKLSSDKGRRAVKSDIHTGAKVLVKLDCDHKLSTPFNTTLFKVVEKNGNSGVIESDGVQYKRNVTHLKKFKEGEHNCLSDEPKLSEIDERVD